MPSSKGKPTDPKPRKEVTESTFPLRFRASAALMQIYLCPFADPIHRGQERDQQGRQWQRQNGSWEGM
jgi:hypothetical protein